MLLFHLDIPGFQFGYFGVDIFFVISGFLMASLYGDMAGRAEIGNYFLRRSARILPAYYVVIVISVLVGIVTLLPHEISMLTTQSLWSAFLLPNFGFWQDAAYFDHTLFRPLLNLWSLGVELQFYLLFPLLLVVQRQSQRLLLLIVCLSFLEYAVFNSIDPRNAFFLLPGRIWEFMVGFYASKFALSASSANPKAGLALLLALLVSLIAFSFIEFENGFLFSCVVVFFSFYIVRHGFSTGSEDGLLSTVLNNLGKYSYSIYLVHFPVIVFINYVPFEGTNLAAESLLKLLIILLVIALFSAALFHGVESRTRKSLTAGKLLGLALASCAMVVGLGVLAPLLNRSSHSIEEINISSALLDRDFIRCDRSGASASLLAASCSVGISEQGARRRFLLHGDSHADGIKSLLAEVLASRGHSLRITGDYAAVNSVSNNAAAIEEARSQDIDVIVLHSLPQADNGAALEEFIQSAKGVGILVAFIAPVPNYQYDIPKKLAVDFQAGRPLDRIGSELQYHLERNKLLFDTLAKLAQRHSNFSWYQSADYLCDENCYISSEQWIPYYFDSNHLTLTGARLLSPVYESIATL